MYIGLKHLHSYFAYLALAILILAVVYSLIGWLRRRPYTGAARLLALWAMIASHLQLLGGLVLYFLSPLGFPLLSGAAMKDSILRLYVLEHPLTMILAIILMTLGYTRAKRLGEDSSKFKQISIFYGLGLILVLIRIPWSAWW